MNNIQKEVGQYKLSGQIRKQRSILTLLNVTSYVHFLYCCKLNKNKTTSTKSCPSDTKLVLFSSVVCSVHYITSVRTAALVEKLLRWRQASI